MRTIALFYSLAMLSSVLTTAALADNTHPARHHRRLLVRERVPAPESLTTIGTPDCHVQGRLLRAANHCPPAAVAAAPR